MPRINQNGLEENTEGLDEKLKEHLASMVITTVPVFVAGVNRRVGLANYEHIDIYAGLALPMTDVSLENMPELTAAIEKAAEVAFNNVSRETYERYKLLVDAQKNA